MKHTIRKAESGEGAHVLNLIKAVLADYSLTIDSGEIDKDLTDLDSYYFNKRGWFFVLEVDERIVGSSAVYRMSDKQCELRKMYLLKEYQGRGFGKLLLEASLKKAVELGYEE